MKFGIISDTHITIDDDIDKVNSLLSQLKEIFNDVDEIIHAGDICEIFFLENLEKIAPVRYVSGENDKINDAKNFIKFSVGRYNIGVIHKLPQDLEGFCKGNKIHILIHGHTHQPIIKGTNYNTLLLNSGSPTQPKAPPKKKGFKTPIARSSVITLNIDENNIISTFIINLKI